MREKMLITEKFVKKMKVLPIDELEKKYSKENIQKLFTNSENIYFNENLFNTAYYLEFESFLENCIGKKWYEIKLIEMNDSIMIYCFLTPTGYLFYIPCLIFLIIDAIKKGITYNDETYNEEEYFIWRSLTWFFDSIIYELSPPGESFKGHSIDSIINQNFSLFITKQLKFFTEWLIDIFPYQKMYKIGEENYILYFKKFISTLNPFE